MRNDFPFCSLFRMNLFSSLHKTKKNKEIIFQEKSFFDKIIDDRRLEYETGEIRD